MLEKLLDGWSHETRPIEQLTYVADTISEAAEGDDESYQWLMIDTLIAALDRIVRLEARHETLLDHCKYLVSDAIIDGDDTSWPAHEEARFRIRNLLAEWDEAPDKPLSATMVQGYISEIENVSVTRSLYDDDAPATAPDSEQE